MDQVDCRLVSQIGGVHRADERDFIDSLWNEPIVCYHYLGHKPFARDQIRHLVFGGPHLLVAPGFGSAAWISPILLASLAAAISAEDISKLSGVPGKVDALITFIQGLAKPQEQSSSSRQFEESSQRGIGASRHEWRTPPL
jgi:hypothetical protein